MIVLGIFEASAILRPLRQFELDRRPALRLCHVLCAIRAAFDSQKFKGHSSAVRHSPENRQHGSSPWLNPVFFNLRFAHGALPRTGQPGEIGQRFLTLSKQAEAGSEEHRQ